MPSALDSRCLVEVHAVRAYKLSGRSVSEFFGVIGPLQQDRQC
jgi:hypothetical protein